MRRALGLFAAVSLAACVQADPETMGGVIEMTDADYLAAYGLPGAAILMTSGSKNDDGSITSAVQFYTAEASAQQLAAAPAILCAAENATVTSSRIIAPTSDFLDDPLSQVLIAECSAPETGVMQ